MPALLINPLIMLTIMLDIMACMQCILHMCSSVIQ